MVVVFVVNLRYGGTCVGTKCACAGAGRGYVRAVRGYGRYVLSFAYPFSKWPQGEVAVDTAVQRYSSTAVQQYMCRGQRTEDSTEMPRWDRRGEEWRDGSVSRRERGG